MKVSIITRHAIPNYGSVLQSYASVKMFENLGYDAEILNYVRYDERGKESVITNCPIGKTGFKNKLKRIAYFCLQYPNALKMNKTFEKFQKQYLRLSNNTYGSIDELKKDLPDSDVFVTGSDQVWGKIGSSEYDPAYFLNFVPANKHKIAYSSSFGKTDLKEVLIKELDGLLESYNSILVREKSAVEIIEKYTKQSAKHILDPTLMLSQDKWNELCEPTGIEGTDYIFVYQLHHNKEMENYVTRIQKETGLPVYRVHPSIFYSLKPGQFIHLPTPGQFLSYIKNAKYMITDSFHGTVFSIIFNNQFIDIIPELTGTRIYSLLDMIGQSDRILKDMNDFSWIDKTIDYNVVNSIIEEKKKETFDTLIQSLPERNNTIESMNQHTDCCGCSACVHLCPKGAISMKEDDDGFKIPRINYELCINCGICYNECPQLKQKQIEPLKQRGYAAKTKDTLALSKSASGGLFYQCAKKILDKKGVVYGAAYNKELSVNHTRIETLQDLPLLQGSKYVQSHMNDTFKFVKEDLENGKDVLFSGTPCQVAGLKTYLRKSYERLITIDIICHGVPSQKMFKKSVEHDESKMGSQMTNYEFRNKEKRGWDTNFKKTFNNGKTSYGSGKLDAYYKAFLDGEIYRECCYKCQYANMQRPSDMTLGDFWGIEKELPDFNAYDGVSCVIVNTEKGQALLDDISNELVIKEVDLDQIVKHNHNLSAPTSRISKRNAMYLNIDQQDFKDMDIFKLHSINIKHYISYIVPTNLKMKLKKLLKG